MDLESKFGKVSRLLIIKILLQSTILKRLLNAIHIHLNPTLQDVKVEEKLKPIL